MQIVTNPDKKDWNNLLERPYVDNTSVINTVQTVLQEVKGKGDEALKTFSKKFDGIALEALQVSDAEVTKGIEKVSAQLKKAIQQAKANIDTFHRGQLGKTAVIETMPGVQCWRKSVAIDKVGLYIPGGTAPLFSTVLMLGVPAQIAGCTEVILCTPPDKEGNIHPAVLYTAHLVGIKKIFKVGGAQAIAAMAYGTESVPAVYKIFGPGNQYVTAAKQLVQMQGVSIDMPAGPSEVCVLADETADAAFVAADLLSQAEHGADSQVLLVSTSAQMVEKVLEKVEEQLQPLPRKELAQKALANSKAIVVNNMQEAIDLVNAYAAEHLILSCVQANAVADKITNAGSVFIGNYSPESVGDYASGTNHTLPTNAFARAYSGVSVDSFVKKITYQKLSQKGLNNMAETVIQMAEAEGLQAHANAVKVRLQKAQ